MLNTVHTNEHRRLAAAVLRMRERAGLSQRDLAKRLAVQQTFISKIETSERNLSVVEFIVVCKATGATPEEIASSVVEVAKHCDLDKLA